MEIEELIKGRWYTCIWNWNDGKPLTFLVDYVNTESNNIFVTRWITPSGPSTTGGFYFKELSNIRPCYSPELQEIIDREMPIDRPYRDSIKLVGNLSSEHQDEIAGDTPENKARTLLLEEAKRRFPMGSKYDYSGTEQLVDFDFEWQYDDCISSNCKQIAYHIATGWATLIDNRKPAPKQNDLDDCSFTYKPDDLSFIDKMDGAMISPASMEDHLIDTRSFNISSTDILNLTSEPVIIHPTDQILWHEPIWIGRPKLPSECFLKSDITIIRPFKRKTLSTDIPSTNAIKESIKHNK